MATLSLEHGNTDGSSLAYAWLGGVFGTRFGDYQAGFRFGRLGVDLVEKRGLDRFRARLYLVFAVHVAHWTQPLATSRALLRRAFEAAQEAGDLCYAVYSRIDLTANLLASGDPLEEAEPEAENGLEFAQKVRFGLANASLTAQFRLIRMLRGLTADFGSLTQRSTSRFVRHLENNTSWPSARAGIGVASWKLVFTLATQYLRSRPQRKSRRCFAQRRRNWSSPNINSMVPLPVRRRSMGLPPRSDPSIWQRWRIITS